MLGACGVDCRRCAALNAYLDRRSSGNGSESDEDPEQTTAFRARAPDGDFARQSARQATSATFGGDILQQPKSCCAIARRRGRHQLDVLNLHFAASRRFRWQAAARRCRPRSAPRTEAGPGTAADALSRSCVNLTERARRGSARSADRSHTSSNARSRCSAGAARTIRYLSVSPASAKPRWRKDWRLAFYTTMCRAR